MNANVKDTAMNKRSREMANIQKTAIITSASQGIGAALVWPATYRSWPSAV
jgi:hypothetical protein